MCCGDVVMCTGTFKIGVITSKACVFHSSVLFKLVPCVWVIRMYVCGVSFI